ncbi:hypothetical protein HDV02_004935 [Globomyces sp. JEL0801]|nr:hypothetical protein HDV02_004935 [Globomyces sp. JEL0801]
MTPLRLKVIEIEGLHQGNNGRTCTIHPVCGKSVEMGMSLKLRKDIIETQQVVMETRDVDIPTPAVGVAKKLRRKKKLQKKLVKVVKTRTEIVVQAWIWKDDVESCLIGFVSKAFVSIYGEDKLDGRIAEISYVLDQSEYECERLRSANENGLIRATILF